jgi:hypothetical protein
MEADWCCLTGGWHPDFFSGGVRWIDALAQRRCCAGVTVRAWPVTTLVRGQVMMDADARPAEPGFGQLRPRETYPLMMPRNEFPTRFNPRA